MISQLQVSSVNIEITINSRAVGRLIYQVVLTHAINYVFI